ncbi:class IIb bacteriocin, lactobin A/cerein 7B family [Lactococcus lactis]|nr:class IIb bacteriocin, lactobin A/cerein 7B family [Lactococcus lactis]RHJ25906.1 class IIb bacteriocin, lactobin A/cerein 7B family [Lactococcus lactis]
MNALGFVELTDEELQDINGGVMESMNDVLKWLNGHSGSVTINNDSVYEIDFG